MNIIMILGFLGQDPETKQVNDTTVTNFSVATSESYKDKTTGERKYISTWHRCVAWGKQGDTIATYFKKGDVIQVTGSLQKRDYDDKEGNKRQAVDIKVTSFTFVPKKKDKDAMQSPTAGVPNMAPGAQAPSFNASEEMPF